MKYLLDTCVISDFIKGQSGVVSKMLSIPPDFVALSTITVMEVEYGLALNKERAKKLKQSLEALFKSVHILPFTEEDAKAAAPIRAYLKQAGLTIGAYDVLLAGTALQRELIFITSNTGEFSRVKGLQVENWRS